MEEFQYDNTNEDYIEVSDSSDVEEIPLSHVYLLNLHSKPSK